MQNKKKYSINPNDMNFKLFTEILVNNEQLNALYFEDISFFKGKSTEQNENLTLFSESVYFRK